MLISYTAANKKTAAKAHHVDVLVPCVVYKKKQKNIPSNSSVSQTVPQTASGFTIPAGHQVCVSPTVNHRLQDTWCERTRFDPDRYLHDNPAAGEKFAYVPFGAGTHTFFATTPAIYLIFFFNLFKKTINQ